MQPILKVAVSVPLSRAFDYLPPADGPVPEPGCRVRVPFGSRQQVGLVLEHTTGSDLAFDKIRRCNEVIDEAPLLRQPELRLLQFTSEYDHHPIGEVAAAAMPAALRHGKALHPLVEIVMATDLAMSTDIETLARRAPKQAELLETVSDAGHRRYQRAARRGHPQPPGGRRKIGRASWLDEGSGVGGGVGG